MSNSFQVQDNTNEYRFLAYLKTALIRCEQKYAISKKIDSANICDMSDQADPANNIEDLLMVEYPLLVGFQNEYLWDALCQLTKKEKYVILESCLAGREHIQIASDLDITLGAERMLFSRTRRKIKAYMEERENELRSTHS